MAGRPKNKITKELLFDTERNKSLGGEVGQPGLYHYAGRITDEILRELTGVSGARNFRQMADNDPTIGALLFAIEQMIRQLKWSVKPTDRTDDNSVEVAEFVTECMKDMVDTWEDTLSGIMSFLVYGFSIHEIVYKRRRGDKHKLESDKSEYNDGKVGWKRLPIRGQESILRGNWKFADNNIDILGVEQQAPPDFKRAIIPVEKYLHFRTTNYKGNPEGKSILRNSYRPWHFKRNIENVEGIGIERELAGLPIMTVPAEIMAVDASPTEKAMYESCKNIVTNIRMDEQAGIILPSQRDENGNLMYELTLLSSGGAKMFDTNKIIMRYRNEMLSTTIADFISLGQGVAGTQALAQTKVDLFLNAIQSWVGQIEAVFNRFAIPRLLRINGIDGPFPQLEAEKIKKSDIDQMVKNILILSQAGMDLFPGDDLEQHVRDKLGFPGKSDSEDEFFNATRDAELEAVQSKSIPKPNPNTTIGSPED